MTVVYCNDDGSNTSPYETLAKAATTFAVAVTQAVAGDDILIGMDHVEDPGANITYSFAGTETAPVRVISINTTTEAYDKADNIQIDNNGAVLDISINGHVKFYGVSIRVGDDLIINTVNCHVLFDDCELEADRSSGAGMEFGATAGRNVVELVNTNVKFPNSNSSAGITLNTGIFEWIGDGTLTLGATMPTALFASGGFRSKNVLVAGVDLSALSSAIFSVSGSQAILAEVHHCELHASVSLTTGTIAETGSRILMNGCDDTTGNSLQRTEYVDFWGSTVEDLDTYRDAGAKDGTINHSMKMVSTGNAAEFSEATRSLPLYAKIRTTGAKTFKIQCLWDSATDAQNNEIYFRLEYLGAAANTQSTLDYSTRMANVLATPADHTTNSEAWTISPSMTNANTFELSGTVTINRVGPVIAHVFLAKPSTTMFVGPLMDVT